MPALTRGDSERLLRFVAEAGSFGGDHPFEGEFLTQLGRLVPADGVAYSDLRRVGDSCHDHGFERPGDEELFCDPDFDWARAHSVLKAECPVHLHIWQGSSGAVKLSDFFTPRELHRTRAYHYVLKPFGLEDTLGVRFPSPSPGTVRLFGFDRVGRNFRARDRAVLDLLHPYLVQLHRAWESRERLREALALHESTRAAVVLLEADDRVAFVSTAARDLLDRYFGEQRARLPVAVASWLRERRRTATGEPLRIETGERALLIELVDGALLLEEQRRLPRLTAREREILDLVAEGRTNAEIAERLWVSPGTVRKHLDNVYGKLGVHTRTAAAALVRGNGGSFPATADADGG